LGRGCNSGRKKKTQCKNLSRSEKSIKGPKNPAVGGGGFCLQKLAEEQTQNGGKSRADREINQRLKRGLFKKMVRRHCPGVVAVKEKRDQLENELP